MRLRRRITAAACVLLTGIIASCQDQTAVSPSDNRVDVRSAILDGSSGGNGHFFFLPPMVASPSPSGKFNASLAPTVEVCRTTSLTTTGHCTTLLASFTTAGGINNNNARVEVITTGEHYRLNWDTRLYVVPIDQPFRIVVLLGDLQIGYSDVVARKGGKYQNANTSAAIDLVNGRTLPIKFRIEHGVVCAGVLECFEGQVGPAGGTFTVAGANDTRPAGTSFPPGALDETVNLFIERVLGECLPTDLQQFQACYRFRTEPHVENFALPVTVGICLLDPVGLPYLTDLQLRLWKWSEQAGDALQELERIEVEYLICPELNATIGSAVQMPWLRALAGLARWIGPREAYAMTGREGGKLSNFSRIGWVRPIALQIMQGDGQTGFASTALSIDPTVRLTNRYGNSQEPVTGWRVDFTPSGDGNAAPPFTLVNAAGQASTTWTLSTQPGANTLLAFVATSRAIAPAPYEVQVTFNANGVARPTVDWLPPLQASALTGTLAGSFSPVVVISELNGSELLRTTATFDATQYQVQWNVPALDPSRIYRIEIQLFDIPLGNVDLQAVGNELRNVSTGEKVLNLDNSRNLPVKFRLLQ